MQHRFLSYKESKISYYLYGHGSQPVVCFHGYGETGPGFEFLGEKAGVLYSFYSIELPFHGQTEWKQGLEFTHTDLVNIVSAICPDEKLFVLGFSLGGRIALSLYHAMPKKVVKLILLAPDGLKVNFWYWLATRTWAGNRFFAFTMKKPGWFFGLLEGMNKLRLVNASIFKFVNFYIGDKMVRQQLYDRWTCLRRLKPNLQRIKVQILEYKTPVNLVYGKHDRIILSSVGEKFRKGIEEHCTVTIIPSGHQVLHEKHAEAILRSLRQ